ncbi:hypothetical protein [Glycomyces albidus]|uniref:Uncharacterized protein n=1 Tax=Glycomyces albidus TaxID=2656774 RepID=A0A6L5G667_9ACTN|nr:hypothetical protein [Glycomyces albidus]MQM25144.1 hypothetical protein [Glycomyces albidus]
MAPLADLPPMPPIPDDELHPRRRPQATSVPPAELEEPDRNTIVVRSNRRLLWWIVAIAWPLTPSTFVLSVYLTASFGVESGSALLYLVQFPPMFAAVFGTMLLAQPSLFTYDVRRRRLTGGTGQIRRALKRWRDGDRLEYSIYLGRLEIVRPSGRRRSVARNSFTVDQRAWTAFADVFLEHQSDRPAGHEGGEPPTAGVPTPSASEPEREISVGVRWRFFGGLLLVGLGTAAIEVAIWLGSSPEGYGPFGSMALVATGYGLFGAIPLIVRPILSFEPGTGRVSKKPLGLPAREFPRPGYERLEYSVYLGVLYEVRADGRRRRVATGWAREQVAWKAFVDRFRSDHTVPAAASGERR